MCCLVRTERPGDEESLDRLITRAFGGSAVAGLVRLLRDDWPGYDRRLSLVAELDGRLVGHVLGLTVASRLCGEAVPAMTVGPVCVDPEHQRRGVGRRLLAALHDAGRDAGARYAVLAGVPSYYPRLGYQACWAFCDCRIDREALPPSELELVAEPIGPADLPWLVERLAAEVEQVDFGLQWPATVLSFSRPGLDTAIWYHAGRRAAYTVCRPSGPFKPPQELFLLADEPALARAVLARLRPASLAHHPAGWLAREVLDPAWATPGALSVTPPCMAFELVDGALGDYLAGLAAGRTPGTVNWPLPFWVC